MPPQPVPQFSLYGEHAPLPAELIHIELIETRSRMHHWHIAPHTHSGMFQVLVLLRGKVRASVDGAHWDCSGPVALTIHPAVVLGFAFSENVMGYVLTLDQGVLSGEQAGQRPDMFAPLFLQPLRIDLMEEPEGMPGAVLRIATLLEQLLAEFDAPREDHDLLLAWLAPCCCCCANTAPSVAQTALGAPSSTCSAAFARLSNCITWNNGAWRATPGSCTWARPG